MISVVQLGLVAYADGLRLQQKMVDLRKAGEIGDVLLLLEHSPVITLGRNAKSANVLVSADQLAARGVEVFECDRGGDVTFHGPGQLVGYPIFDLRGFPRQPCSPQPCPPQPCHPERSGLHEVKSVESKDPYFARDPVLAQTAVEPAQSAGRKTLGVVDYVRRLEEVLIRACGDFGIPTQRIAGLTGVWTEASQSERNREGHDRGPQHACFSRDGVEDLSRADTGLAKRAALAAEGQTEAKIAALGVHISRSVTSHGFALNVNTDLSYFDLIVPCGIPAKPVTSMQQELGREVDLNEVAQKVSRNFGLVFSSQMLWIETIDALLGDSVGVPLKIPDELRRVRGEDDVFLA